MNRATTDLVALANRLEQERTRAIEDFRAGRANGLATANALSHALDRFVREVLRPWSDPRCGFALLALGSYGRKALSLRSDLDGVILYESPEPKEPIHALSAAVRALWDAGIRARVAAYSLARARTLATRDERVLASLLDHRYVSGSKAIVTDLERILAEIPDQYVRGLTRLIQREDRARTGTRHLDLFAAEPDIKTGQGGLRDLAALGWFARWARTQAAFVCDRDRRLLFHSIVRQAIREVYRHTEAIRRAREVLQIARLLLDVADIPGERFTREAASVLERESVPAYVPIEFERHLLMARLRVHALLGALLDALTRPRTPTRKAQTVRLEPASFSETPSWLKIVASSRPRARLDAAHRSGLLFRIVPGFQRTLGIVPGDEVHAFTLDRHLVLAASNVSDILDGLAPVPPGTEDAVETGRRHRVTLIFAALLHDLGKATVSRPRSAPRGPHPTHAEAGARLAKVAALKTGLSPDQADMVAFLCRYHMVLPEVSTTLDCESPNVLERLDSLFHDAASLDLAFLLGLADMRSLGPGISTTFRESLLARTWAAIRRWKQQKRGLLGWEAEAATRRHRLLARCAPDRTEALLSDLVLSLPDRLLMAFDPDRLWDLLVRFEEVRQSGPLVLLDPATAEGENEHRLHDIVYLGYDEMGLLSRLSGGLTLQGLSILEARIFSIPAGPTHECSVPAPPLVLDQFRVTDPGGVIGESPLERQALCNRILGWVSDPTVARRVQVRIREALRARRIEMVAEIDNSSLPDRTVFRVCGPDTPGLLHVLADILFRHGINVSGAIVTTESGTVRDTFFAEWAASGGKVLDPEVIRKVLREVARIGRSV